MKIIVFNVAAEKGGALTVLYDYYEKFKKDTQNEYILILSRIKINSCKNISVYNYPWIKKSWLHRIYFELFISNKLVKNFHADEILSLQNMVIPFAKIKQTLLIQNVIPFSDFRFKLFRNPSLWFYQNVLSIMIIKSIKKADLVITQSTWMMELLKSKYHIESNKITVNFPVTVQDNLKKYNFCGNRVSFIYPASDLEYKNHLVIIKACMKLKEKFQSKYTIYFTFSKNSSRFSRYLQNIISKHTLPIELIGQVPQEVLFDYYSKSALIFPSFIETVGLPLIEASSCNSPIIASNLIYAHSALNGYNNVRYFDPNKETQLSELMEDYISKCLVI